MTPFIKEEFETINAILNNGSSIARFGDGEFKLCAGKDQVAQSANKGIQERLINIAVSDVNNLLIGIPRVSGRNDMANFNPSTHNAWQNFKRKKWTRFVNLKKQYYSSFITRPDSAIHIDCDKYWNLCKQIWQGRSVAIVEGSGRFKAIEDNLLRGCKSVKYIDAPSRDAWCDYELILNACMAKSTDHIFLIALGCTGTVLAYDLHKAGYQALDLGHFPMFYSRSHKKAYELKC